MRIYEKFIEVEISPAVDISIFKNLDTMDGVEAEVSRRRIYYRIPYKSNSEYHSIMNELLEILKWVMKREGVKVFIRS